MRKRFIFLLIIDIVIFCLLFVGCERIEEIAPTVLGNEKKVSNSIAQWLNVSYKKTKNTSFDTFGYDVSIEDIEIYVLANARVNPVSSYKMLSFLGYSINDDVLEKAENYSKAQELLNEGGVSNLGMAYEILSKNIFFLDSQNICYEIKEGISFSVGEKGPAGGIVFYDKGYYSDGWRYLEVASKDLSGTYPFGYYRTSSSGPNSIVGTEFAIGTGKTNTEALVKAMGETTYTSSDGTTKGIYAAKACADYSITVDGVIYDDWFLPSRDELDLMYNTLYKNNLGSFAKDDSYWSSSEYSDHGNYAWKKYFYSGGQGHYNRYNKHRVRPIRAF